MPGELGNEYEQQSVGYYERRYEPHKDWQNDNYGTVNNWSDVIPEDKLLIKLLKKMRGEEEEDK